MKLKIVSVTVKEGKPVRVIQWGRYPKRGEPAFWELETGDHDLALVANPFPGAKVGHWLCLLSDLAAGRIVGCQAVAFQAAGALTKTPVFQRIWRAA